MKRIFSDTTPPASPRLPGSPLTPISPVRRRMTIGDNTVAGYRFYRVLADKAMTPMRLKAHGICYDYRLVVGLPETREYPLILATLYPSTCSWPQNAGQFDLDQFVFIESNPELQHCPRSAETGALLAEDGSLVVKVRAVIDDEGKLVTAYNGAGTAKVPFHHQMVFASPIFDKDTLTYGSDLYAGDASVIFAGEIGFGQDGLIYYISNRSGHFVPGPEALNALLDYLALHPANLAETIVCSSFDEATVVSTCLTRDEILARAAQIRPEASRLFSATQGQKMFTVSSPAQEPRHQPHSDIFTGPGYLWSSPRRRAAAGISLMIQPLHLSWPDADDSSLSLDLLPRPTLPGLDL